MRKKFILKPTIWEFDFADEEALPTSSIGSCLDVSSKRVRRLSPVCGGATADTSMIEVAPPRPSESVPVCPGEGCCLVFWWTDCSCCHNFCGYSSRLSSREPFGSRCFASFI